MTELSARVTVEGDGLKASLSDGRSLSAQNIRDLAAMLVAAGVHVDYAHCADWKEGEISPGAGTAIALKVAMRRFDHLTHTSKKP